MGLCAFAKDDVVTLEEAIRSGAREIGSSLRSGTTIAVVFFRSGTSRMSNHVLEELTDALVNERGLIVVDRGDALAAARKELALGTSLELSEESAQWIGHLLGAQMLVYGSMSKTGENYSFRIRVLEAETAAIRYSETFDVLNNSQGRTQLGIIENFTGGERFGTAVLNLAFGLGSFVIQKDGRGGAITTALEGVGVAAVVTSFFLVGEKVVDYVQKPDTSLSTPFFIGGLALYAGGAIHGVFRALSYQKPGVNVAMNGVAETPLPWNIALVPDINGNTAVRLSYTLRF
jgi:TolB-like protein